VCKNRTFDIQNPSLSCPIQQGVPISAFVIDCKAWPRPLIVGFPRVAQYCIISMAHKRLAESIYAVVDMHELFLDAVLGMIVRPINLFTDNIEKMQLDKNIYSGKISAFFIVEGNSHSIGVM